METVRDFVDRALELFNKYLHNYILNFNKMWNCNYMSIFNKEALALRISREMFNEKRSIESFNAYQCIRSYLFELSTHELITLAKEYGIEVGKVSDDVSIALR